MNAIETLLEYHQEIEKLYKTTIKNKAFVKDSKFEEGWKEYSETIDAFMELKRKVSNDAKNHPQPPAKSPPPETTIQNKSENEKKP